MAGGIFSYLISIRSQGANEFGKLASQARAFEHTSANSFNRLGRSVLEYRNAVRSIGGTSWQTFDALSRGSDHATKNLNRTIGMIAGGGFMGGFVKRITQANGELQANEILFNSMIGNGSKANDMVDRLQQNAARYGQNISEVFKSAKGFYSTIAFQSGRDKVKNEDVENLLKITETISALDVENRGLSFSAFSIKETLQGLGSQDWRSLNNRLEIKFPKETQAAITKAFKAQDYTKGIEMFQKALYKAIPPDLLDKLMLKGFSTNVARLGINMDTLFQRTFLRAIDGAGSLLFIINEGVSKMLERGSQLSNHLMQASSLINQNFINPLKSFFGWLFAENQTLSEQLFFGRMVLMLHQAKNVLFGMFKITYNFLAGFLGFKKILDFEDMSITFGKIADLLYHVAKRFNMNLDNAYETGVKFQGIFLSILEIIARIGEAIAHVFDKETGISSKFSALGEDGKANKGKSFLDALFVAGPLVGSILLLKKSFDLAAAPFKLIATIFSQEKPATKIEAINSLASKTIGKTIAAGVYNATLGRTSINGALLGGVGAYSLGGNAEYGALAGGTAGGLISVAPRLKILREEVLASKLSYEASLRYLSSRQEILKLAQHELNAQRIALQFHEAGLRGIKLQASELSKHVGIYHQLIPTIQQQSIALFSLNKEYREASALLNIYQKMMSSASLKWLQNSAVITNIQKLFVNLYGKNALDSINNISRLSAMIKNLQGFVLKLGKDARESLIYLREIGGISQGKRMLGGFATDITSEASKISKQVIMVEQMAARAYNYKFLASSAEAGANANAAKYVATSLKGGLGGIIGGINIASILTLPFEYLATKKIYEFGDQGLINQAAENMWVGIKPSIAAMLLTIGRFAAMKLIPTALGGIIGGPVGAAIVGGAGVYASIKTLQGAIPNIAIGSQLNSEYEGFGVGKIAQYAQFVPELFAGMLKHRPNYKGSWSDLHDEVTSDIGRRYAPLWGAEGFRTSEQAFSMRQNQLSRRSMQDQLFAKLGGRSAYEKLTMGPTDKQYATLPKDVYGPLRQGQQHEGFKQLSTSMRDTILKPMLDANVAARNRYYEAQLEAKGIGNMVARITRVLEEMLGVERASANALGSLRLNLPGMPKPPVQQGVQPSAGQGGTGKGGSGGAGH